MSFQQLWIRPAQHSGGIFNHSSLQNHLSSVLLRSFYSISMGLSSELWLGHYTFYKLFCGGFTLILRVIFLVHLLTSTKLQLGDSHPKNYPGGYKNTLCLSVSVTKMKISSHYDKFMQETSYFQMVHILLTPSLSHCMSLDSASSVHEGSFVTITSCNNNI